VGKFCFSQIKVFNHYGALYGKIVPGGFLDPAVRNLIVGALPMRPGTVITRRILKLPDTQAG